jgi:hypothetical protein
MSNPESESKAVWTVMVLMGADNLSGEIDLTAAAKSDLTEMAEIGSRPGILNIVVQIDQPEGPERYYIAQGGKQLLKGDADGVPLDQTSGPKVLESFLSWAQTKYEAQHYLLVLWGHAYRLAFNRDPEAPEGLDFPRLAEVLANTNKDGRPIDIVAFDSCNVSLIEGAYQLRTVAQYLVASQFTDPIPGWPYKTILERLVKDPTHFNKTNAEGSKDFGRAIVSQFVRHYSEEKSRAKADTVRRDSVTMTMLDLTRAADVVEKIGTLADALAIAVDADDAELAAVRDLFERSQVPNSQPAVDLVTLCWNLAVYTGSDDVKVAAFELGSLILGPAEPFVIAHGRSDLVVAMLNGVSIIAPNAADEDVDVESLRTEYETLEIAQETLWGEFVFALAEAE